jgi:hypothetical protein
MKVMVSYFVSDTHKVTNTLILVPHLSSCCKFGFAGTERMFYIQSIIVEFALQSHGYVRSPLLCLAPFCIFKSLAPVSI